MLFVSLTQKYHYFRRTMATFSRSVALSVALTRKASPWQGDVTQDRSPFMSTFRTSDDKLVTISYIGDASFKKLMGVLGLDLVDERTSSQNLRIKNRNLIIDSIAAAVAERTRADIVDSVAGAGVPVAPVNSYADLLEEQQVWDNGYFLELPGKTLGPNDDIPAVVVGSPARFSETPAQPRDIGKPQCPPTELIAFADADSACCTHSAQRGRAGHGRGARRDWSGWGGDEGPCGGGHHPRRRAQ